MHAPVSPTGSHRHATDAADRRFVGALVRGEAPWDSRAVDTIGAQLDWLAREGLLPLLAHRVAADAVDVPPATRARLDTARRQLAARELAIATPMRNALSALADARIAVLVMKGEALAHAVYATPATRDRGDVDLWVAPHDFDRAGDVLLRQGFAWRPSADGAWVQTERAYEHATVPQLVVDLHRAAFGQGALDAALPFADVYARGIAHDDLGTRRPDAADAVIIAALHRIAHHADGSARLLWLYDIDLLARTDAATLDVVATRAVAGRVAAIVANALRDTRDMFDTPIANAVLATLDASAADEPSAALLRAPSPLRRAWIDVATLPGARAKLGFVRDHLFPSRAFMRWRFPAAPSWAWPLLYPWRMIGGIARALFARR